MSPNSTSQHSKGGSSRSSKSSVRHPNDKKGPYVTTGPIIGMVTDTTARIVAELSEECTVKCFLIAEDGDGSVVVSQNFLEKRPAAFSFTGLKPATRYKATFNVPVPGLTKAGFKTIPTNWDIEKDKARIAFVSCNKYRITRDDVPEKTDLWKDLFKKVSRGEVDYVCHMGDNVYADSDLYDIEEGLRDFKGEKSDCRWQIAMSKLEDVPPNRWPSYYNEICEVFRTIYRETWGHPPCKHALANVPNLMIMDDHDIRDDWGDRDVDRDPTSKDFFVGCCAYEVYNEFQRNLFEDYEPGSVAHDSCRVGQAYHFHVFGDIGLMFTDARACKSFHRNYDEPEKDAQLPLLGAAQWKDIELALSKDGYFSGVRMLFAITPMPPCYVGEGPNMAVAKMGGKYYDDLYGSWAATYHVPEASLFLSALFDWRAKSPGVREVCIVAGDVHQGGYTDIIDLRYLALRDHRLDRMKQMVASAISNVCWKRRESAALALGRTMVNGIGKWHQFSHYNWTGSRNFGVATVYADHETEDPNRQNSLNATSTRFTLQLFSGNVAGKKAMPEINSTHRTFALSGGWATCFVGQGDCGSGGMKASRDMSASGMPGARGSQSGSFYGSASYYGGGSTSYYHTGSVHNKSGTAGTSASWVA